MSNKLLVKAILDRASDYAWSIQGFGMLRLYLSSAVRLHVWDERYRVPGVSDIHDHPWDFDSEIIAGEVRQRRYRVEPASQGGMCGAPIRCGMGAQIVGHLAGEAQTFDLYSTHEERYVEGETYSQRRDEVHQSMPETGTVTLVTRRFSADPDHARVFWPRGEQWVSAEPRTATAEEVRSIVSSSLSRWFQ